MTVSIHMETPSALRKFVVPETATGHPTEDQVAAVLTAGLGIDDAVLKSALTTHLTGRLDDLDETVSRAERSLFGAIADAGPSGPWRQVIIHLAQWKEDSLPGSIEELLAAPSRYGEADLAGWRQQVAGLAKVSDRLELFTAFADIEDAFEPFEEQMTDLDVRIDLEEQREIDRRRGKWPIGVRRAPSGPGPPALGEGRGHCVRMTDAPFQDGPYLVEESCGDCLDGRGAVPVLKLTRTAQLVQRVGCGVEKAGSQVLPDKARIGGRSRLECSGLAGIRPAVFSMRPATSVGKPS